MELCWKDNCVNKFFQCRSLGWICGWHHYASGPPPVIFKKSSILFSVCPVLSHTAMQVIIMNGCPVVFDCHVASAIRYDSVWYCYSKTKNYTAEKHLSRAAFSLHRSNWWESEHQHENYMPENPISDAPSQRHHQNQKIYNVWRFLEDNLVQIMRKNATPSQHDHKSHKFGELCKYFNFTKLNLVELLMTSASLSLGLMQSLSLQWQRSLHTVCIADHQDSHPQLWKNFLQVDYPLNQAIVSFAAGKKKQEAPWNKCKETY